ADDVSTCLEVRGVLVRYGVVEGLGQRVAGRELLHQRIGVVERVGVAAVGAEHDRAVAAGAAAVQRGDVLGGGAVTQGVVGAHVEIGRTSGRGSGAGGCGG